MARLDNMNKAARTPGKLSLRWQQIAAKVDSLSLRERRIIFVMAFVVVGGIFNSVGIEPLLKKRADLTKSFQAVQDERATLQQAIALKVKTGLVDPDKENKQKLAALNAERTELERALGDMQKGLVSPEAIPKVLETLLKRHDRLQMTSLRSLPPEAIALAQISGGTVVTPGTSKIDSPKETVATPTMYRHAVEVTLQGSYLDLLSYSRALESAPTQLFWRDMQLSTTGYPMSTLKFTIFTISLDKKWMHL